MRSWIRGLLLLSAALPPVPALARTGEAPLFTVTPDKANARVTIRLPAADAEGVLGRFLYTPSIASGLGAPDLAADRAGLGQTQIIVFRRVGKRVLAMFENNRFRALSGDAGEERAVRASFAPSIVWAGEASDMPDGSVSVDLSGFLLRDVMNLAGRLKQGKAGAYKLAPTLSYVDTAESVAFPDNVEFQSVLTFESDEPGAIVNRIVPDAKSVTFAIHHSFVRLPDANFHPRAHDPRTGTSAQVIRNDYAAPLDQPIVSRLVRRFRLEKTDPHAARSRVVKPIVFYVDRAAPEAIRTALTEGARWWAQAFDAAGYIDAFRVETLPENVNPMDVRYNVIAWVHRATRGWSTGTTVVDPRTGEIVRGVVQLGSLRAWQDRLIFDGLIGASREGSGGSDDPIMLVRARLRQLAVHEVGHAIGLAHNFAGSTYAGRASVMDYPAPLISVKGDKLDFSNAYATSVGAWDKFAIQWLYGAAPRGANEAAWLDALARKAQADGYRNVTDGDTRGVGDAQPYGNMWDNGPDAVAELANVLAVRRIALSRFGPDNLPEGSPAADLRRMIVPIYLYHRYQVTAVSKLIAGVDYGYAVAGDGHDRATIVPAARQREALAALIGTLDPKLLDLPDTLLAQLSSIQPGTPDPQYQMELFPSNTAATFDLPSAAETAADQTLEALLAPERLNRLIEQARVDPGQLSLGEMLDKLSAALVPAARGREGELRRRIRARYAVRLATVMQDKQLSATALGVVRGAATRFGEKLRSCTGDSTETDACAYLAAMLTGPAAQLRALAEPVAKSPEIPPGAPIGDDGIWEDDWLTGPITTRTFQ
ncbi:MAG: zinc-dependent metalloprotease [Candidatus Sphingomonas colombiensis]|nr:zinc-dependent metalloprotease [Sphingomonas sp.]WEK43731.1 MAG: zinc-dependent metalloprotease [Sphingomonas sp.]